MRSSTETSTTVTSSMPSTYRVSADTTRPLHILERQDRPRKCSSSSVPATSAVAMSTPCGRTDPAEVEAVRNAACSPRSDRRRRASTPTSRPGTPARARTRAAVHARRDIVAPAVRADRDSGPSLAVVRRIRLGRVLRDRASPPRERPPDRRAPSTDGPGRCGSRSMPSSCPWRRPCRRISSTLILSSRSRRRSTSPRPAGRRACRSGSEPHGLGVPPGASR